MTVHPSTEPNRRLGAQKGRMATVGSSDPVTKWNQRGYPHFTYSS
jgi:hypothetical protein